MSSFKYMEIPAIETKSLAEIKAYQEKKLPETLTYLARHSTFYKHFFKTHQIDITSVRKLEDLQKIPPTSKMDLQKYNFDFLCTPQEKIIDYITTSGTAGEPVTFAVTDNDLERLAYNEAISFACAGGTSNDIYQLMVTLDRRFMAGMAYFLGARKMGAGIVRTGPGNPELQFDTIQRIKPSVLVTVPSFLLKLIEYAEARGINYRNMSVKSAICIGEPLRNASFQLNKIGQQIKEKWDLNLYSTYASTEMGAAFTECRHNQGGHHHPELLITEFLDDKNKPVAEGELGEVTITSLGVEAMPLLRFKTGDLCYHYTSPCECGRNTLRLSPVIGRKNQMIKYKGTTLYPPALYDILNEIKNVENYVVEVSTNNFETDEINILIGTENNSPEFIKSIKDHFRARLRVAPAITICHPKEIQKKQFPEMSRKPVTFVDYRKRANKTNTNK